MKRSFNLLAAALLMLCIHAGAQTKTIDEFTALTGAASGDELLIYDVSASSPRTRKITVGNLSLALTPSWASIASKPTTLSGFGITDAQPLDSDLTTYAGITPSANVQTLLGAANFAAFKTSLSLNAVENTALSTWAGSTNITTVGAINPASIGQGTPFSIASGTTLQIIGNSNGPAYSGISLGHRDSAVTTSTIYGQSGALKFYVGGADRVAIDGSGGMTLGGVAVPTISSSDALTNKSYNGMTITANSGTLHIANAKSFDVLHSITLDGTDGTTMTFPSASGTVATLAATQTLTNKTISSASNTITIGSGVLTTAAITGLTEDTTPDSAADFVMTYDASAAALKKVKLTNLGAGGGSTIDHGTAIAWVGTTGNDGTGVPGDPAHPYATAQAAFDDGATTLIVLSSGVGGITSAGAISIAILDLGGGGIGPITSTGDAVTVAGISHRALVPEITAALGITATNCNVYATTAAAGQSVTLTDCLTRRRRRSAASRRRRSGPMAWW